MAYKSNKFKKRYAGAFSHGGGPEGQGIAAAEALREGIANNLISPDVETPNLVFNGDFEIVDDRFKPPGGWTIHAGTTWRANFTYASGSIFAHHSGARAVAITGRPGSASEIGISSDFFPAADQTLYQAGALLRPQLSAAGTNAQMYIDWYTDLEVFISSSLVFDSAFAVNTWHELTAFATSPSNTRYGKVRIEHGNASVDAGTINFDRVWVRRQLSEEGMPALPWDSFPGTLVAVSDTVHTLNPVPASNSGRVRLTRIVSNIYIAGLNNGANFWTIS